MHKLSRTEIENIYNIMKEDKKIQSVIVRASTDSFHSESDLEFSNKTLMELKYSGSD